MKLSFRLARWCARMLGKRGFSGVRAVGEVLGTLMWYAIPTRRKLATENIRKHLGYTEEEARTIAQESFRQNGRSFLECVMIPEFALNHPMFHIPRPDLLERIQNADFPIVITAGHIGAWELLAGPLADAPEPRPRMMVVRTYRNATLQDLSVWLRGSRGASVCGHREATLPVLRALKKNGVAAFLVDHNASRDESVFLPFLGEEAAVNRGPALLAVRGKAQIWPVFMVREGDGFSLHMEEPLDTTKLEGDTEKKIVAAARFYTEAVERVIRSHPEQWFWMHNRWKTRRSDD